MVRIATSLLVLPLAGLAWLPGSAQDRVKAKTPTPVLKQDRGCR